MPVPAAPSERLRAASPAYWLGVDGGGTKTTALLADAHGRVLGRANSGPSNFKTMGEAAALKTIWAAIGAAYAAAGLSFRLPRTACLGLAGVDRPDEQARAQAALAQRLPGVSLAIVNDVELVLAAGTPEGWGVAVIAGTGAIAYGRTPAGRAARVGGWGWAIGDEGSGFAIGRAALQAVTRAADGRGPQTALTAAILEHWSLGAPEDLFPIVYQTPVPRTQIASLAVVVEAAAGAGDAVALALTHEAGRELALAAVALARHLELTGCVPAALAGGVLVHGRTVQRAFGAALETAGLRLEPIQTVTEPAQGALTLARRLPPASA